jgi:hypothetical protein
MIMPDIRFNEIGHGVEIAKLSGGFFNPVSDHCISRVTPEGNLRGGVVYSGYTGRGGSVGMHAAGLDPRWISRDLLWVCFDYPFNQLAVKKIFGQVPASKPDVLDFDLALGFKYVTTIEDVYPDGDMILLAMYREDCRFLRITPRNLRSGS